jgi:hypothetical protein
MRQGVPISVSKDKTMGRDSHLKVIVIHGKVNLLGLWVHVHQVGNKTEVIIVVDWITHLFDFASLKKRRMSMNYSGNIPMATYRRVKENKRTLVSRAEDAF